MTANHSPGHADADLIRYLDGELTAEDRTRIEAALATDGNLARRLDTLRRRGIRLRSMLSAADPSAAETDAARPVTQRDDTTPDHDAGSTATVTSIDAGRARREARVVRPGAGGSRWLRAAAIILALAGAAMVVPPVRAWVIDQLQKLGGEDGRTDTPTQPADGVASAAADTLPVTFAVTQPSFDIVFESAQVGGRRLTLRSTEDAAATIQISGASEGITTLPASLRIANTATAAVNYELSLPALVKLVRVRIGETVIAEVAMTATDTTVIDLALPRR